MRNPARYQVWLIVSCCYLFLAACAKQDAAHLAETTPLINSPVSTRGLEPVVPEPVNRTFQRSCRSCHGPDGRGILAIAPDLRKASSRSAEQWQQFLSNPQNGHFGADLSPPTWLNVDEVVLIADYLANLTAQNPPLAVPNKHAQQSNKPIRRAR